MFHGGGRATLERPDFPVFRMILRPSDALDEGFPYPRCFERLWRGSLLVPAWF